MAKQKVKGTGVKKRKIKELKGIKPEKRKNN